MEPKEIERLEKITEQIGRLKKAAWELKNISGGIQALECNTQRILAGVKMLEINFSDLREMVGSDRGVHPLKNRFFLTGFL